MPRTVHTRYVTPQRYRQWLLQQAPERIIGLAANCRGCPLATFLSETHPHGCDWVGERTWYDGHWDTEHVLPRWARHHQQVIDESTHYEITAELALRWLEGL